MKWGVRRVIKKPRRKDKAKGIMIERKEKERNEYARRKLTNEGEMRHKES